MTEIIKVEGREFDGVARRRNELISSKFRLSLHANRLFLFVLSKVEDRHNEDTEYEFSVNELARAIGIDRSNLYKEMAEVVEELARTIVSVQVIGDDGKPMTDRFVRIGLIKNRQQVRVIGEGQSRVVGSMSVSIYKELLPYVRELKERYTETQLKYMFRLGSSYTQKLYDLLKVRAFTGRPWRVTRDELLDLLVVEPGKFQLWGDFRRFVLEKAQIEINTHTDLAFDIEYMMAGRTVSAVVFHLRKEGGAEIEILPGTQKHVVFKGMLDLGLSAKVAEQVLSDVWATDPDLVRWHLAKARAKKAEGSAKNLVGWFLDGIKTDYRPQRSLFAGMRANVATKRDDYKATTTSADAELLKALDEVKRAWSADAPRA